MTDWMTEILKQYGSLGVGFLMLLENIFPPIPSEVVMPWSGYAVSQGEVTFLGTITAGSLGSFAGAMFWYLLAKQIGGDRLRGWADRHGAWLTVSRGDLERTERWFEKWGSAAVLLCRMVPGLRTLISVPAGIAEMPIGRFSLFTAIGTVIWTTLLAVIGWWLGDNYSNLVGPLGWVSNVVVAVLVLIWLYRLIKQHRRRPAKSPQPRQ